MTTARALAVSGTEAFRHQSLFLAQLDQNRAAVAEAEASLANALSDEKRAHTVTSGVISKQTIEQRETLVKTTTAKLAAARAIVEETKARLAQTEIVAPANAIVATRTATLGAGCTHRHRAVRGGSSRPAADAGVRCARLASARRDLSRQSA